MTEPKAHTFNQNSTFELPQSQRTKGHSPSKKKNKKKYVVVKDFNDGGVGAPQQHRTPIDNFILSQALVVHHRQHESQKCSALNLINEEGLLAVGHKGLGNKRAEYTRENIEVKDIKSIETEIKSEMSQQQMLNEGSEIKSEQLDIDNSLEHTLDTHLQTSPHIYMSACSHVPPHPGNHVNTEVHQKSLIDIKDTEAPQYDQMLAKVAEDLTLANL